MHSSTYSVGDLVQIRSLSRDQDWTKVEPLVIINCDKPFPNWEGNYTLWSASLGKTFYIHGNDLKPYGK